MTLSSLLPIFIALSLIGRVASSCSNITSYWGYWGVNLNETDTPNIVFDLEDPVQLTIARDRGKIVLFNLQKLLFDFTITTYPPAGNQEFLYAPKSGWQAIFDAAYGNATHPTNPYGVSGLTANAPNGFITGFQLMWYGLHPSDLYTVVNYVHSKFPTAIIAHDDNARIWTNVNNINGDDFVFDIYSPITLLSVSGFWPDQLWQTEETGYIDECNVAWIYYFVKSYMGTGVKMVWSVAMYDTTSEYQWPSCHAPETDNDCEPVMANRFYTTLTAICHDISDCGVNPPECAGGVPTDKMKGVWVWRWNTNMSLTGYEYGMEDMNFHEYEQYLSPGVCNNVISDAPIVLINGIVFLFLILSILV